MVKASLNPLGPIVAIVFSLPSVLTGLSDNIPGMWIIITTIFHLCGEMS